MKVNKELMTKARFERKLISELTVKEFRELTREMMHNAFRFEEELNPSDMVVGRVWVNNLFS